ncbi:G-protein coupled receptor family C group 6 member A-like [Pelodytes ibericus]
MNIVWSCFLWRYGQSWDMFEHPAARLPGDIVIGGIFPIHKGVSNLSKQKPGDAFICTGLHLRSMTDAFTMIYAIESINNSTILPGITLGYEIYDSCADSLKATQAILRLIPGNVTTNNPADCNTTNNIPIIKAVIGEEYSEISIAISRVLGIHFVPQISPASSAAILSDKVRFPSFLRTIPNDEHQTKAIVQLIKTFGWNWVGLISSDDDYGRSALDFLNILFAKQGICTAFSKIVPSYVEHPDMPSVITSVIDELITTTTQVVVIITKGPIVWKLFNEALKGNISKTWIASDAWSTSKEVAYIQNIEKIGTIFGLNFKEMRAPGLAEYLENLYPPDHGATNEFLKEYKESRFGCTEEYKSYIECIKSSLNNCTLSESITLKSPLACKVENVAFANDDYLMKNTEWGKSHSTFLAITAIAQAIKSIMCKYGTCEKNQTLSPYELLQELRAGNFSTSGEKFRFDSFGDVLIGYDVLNWHSQNGSTEFQIVGNYNMSDGMIELNQSLLMWNTGNALVPFSNCSKSCTPGQYKKHSSISCCYECIPCADGYFSPIPDDTECGKCPHYQWSYNGSSRCENRTITCFYWSDPFAIVLVTFAGFGFLLIVLIGILFCKFSDTPAVKAAGGNYTYLMMISLLSSLVSIGFFLGKPSDTICKIRQSLYGTSFTLCVSCILIKSLRIILAFASAERVKKITYHPLIIIIFLISIQICICISWLIMKGPVYKENYMTPQNIILQCDEGSYVFFGIMLGYIGILALSCLILAYKGRKLPEKYNEAKCITFSMLIYIFVWIVFIPIYMNTSGTYLSAVQVVAILASVYGVISCHLLPASYIILFKRNICNRENYLQSIRAFYRNKQRILSIYQNKSHPQTSPIDFGLDITCSKSGPLQPKRLATLIRRRRKSF